MRNYDQVSSLAIILFQKKDRDKLPWQKNGKSYLLSSVAERSKKINFLQLQNVSWRTIPPARKIRALIG